MSLKPKEFIFDTSLKWTEGHKGMLSSKGKEDIEVACPPEFCDGPANIWTPEDFFVASTEVCLMMTFIYLAEAFNFSFISYESSASGIAKMEDKHVRFTEITLKPILKVNTKEDIKKANRILKKAENLCLISKSITTKVNVIPDILAIG